MDMSRATYVPITGAVLEWARREAGFTVASLAMKIQVSPSDISAWEAESAQPNKTQFGKLLAALRRPSALFFADSPPASAPLRASFRRASGEYGTASVSEFGPLQTARRYQQVAEWLYEEMPDVRVPAISSFVAKTRVNPATVAKQVRLASKLNFAQQTNYKTYADALKGWRKAAEDNLGVLVFYMQFPREARTTRGFSLPSDTAPVVVLNTAFIEQARIFTLFHEIAHLILQDAMVCDIWGTSDTASTHERWAESFAANFLLPGEEFGNLVRSSIPRDRIITTDLIRSLSSRTRVSVRATALRVVELGYAGWDLYDRVVTETKEVDYKAGPSGGGGGEITADRRFRELGPRLPNMLFDARDDDIIGHYDLLKYLDMDSVQAATLERALNRRGHNSPSPITLLERWE